MMAMRYGTLPLVHEVGGLRDTVQPFNAVDGSGTGFSFNNLSGYWFTGRLMKPWLSTTMTNRLGMVSKSKL